MQRAMKMSNGSSSG